MFDPREKNQTPHAKTISEYLNGYVETVQAAVRTVSPEKMDLVFSLLKEKLEQGAQIFAAGNGGSAAISAHLCCDWVKGTRMEGEPTLKVHSLMENTSLLTALANDVSYEEAVAEQIKAYGKAGDCVILLSCSGNSPNVVRAAQVARQMDIDVISMTGFDGGKLAAFSDISLHVPANNYGMIEDCHQMLMHVFSQYLYLWRIQQAENRPARSTAASAAPMN
ncbi:MAG: SIS domain-containing protein [Deltaproteobacteria bacterium]|nr:SIS domain-containing protein [Deltaproteobacteria bacterium]MBI3294782.1 SIS domain-containing protein [Deltaproteobacteria bacterium]